SQISLLLSSTTPTPPTELYTLSLHDALSIWPDLFLSRADQLLQNERRDVDRLVRLAVDRPRLGVVPHEALGVLDDPLGVQNRIRSEEHTSELQSRENLVCRHPLEKKNTDHIR